MKQADVIIIGGGVIGCSIACELRRAFQKVVVVERGQPGQEASLRAAGMLAPHAGAQRLSPMFRLCREALKIYPQWVEAIERDAGVCVEYKRNGLLYCAFTDSDEEFLEKKLAWQEEAGVLTERVSSQEARRMEPELSESVRWALYFPEDQQIDNVKLMQALLICASRLGVHFVNSVPVTEILIQNSRVQGIKAGKQTLAAPIVINSAGSWAGTGFKLPFPVPVKPAKGQIVVLEHQPPLFQRVIQTRRAYLVPRNDGRMIVGSTVEFVGYDTSVTAQAMERLVRGALQMGDAVQQARFREAWAGLRPCSRDRRPILGGTEVEGLFIATGHFRSGILLAPITAQLIRELSVEGKTSFPIEPFHIARFRLRSEKPLRMSESVP